MQVNINIKDSDLFIWLDKTWLQCEVFVDSLLYEYVTFAKIKCPLLGQLSHGCMLSFMENLGTCTEEN